MAEREPTGQDRLLWSLCRPERLIELARRSCSTTRRAVKKGRALPAVFRHPQDAGAGAAA